MNQAYRIQKGNTIILSRTIARSCGFDSGTTCVINSMPPWPIAKHRPKARGICQIYHWRLIDCEVYMVQPRKKAGVGPIVSHRGRLALVGRIIETVPLGDIFVIGHVRLIERVQFFVEFLGEEYMLMVGLGVGV